jgi:hypothetical protein
MMRSPGPAFDLRAAIARELTAAAEELAAAQETPSAVHRCRVRLKRARTLARIGRPCAPGLADIFNQTARSAMNALAPARELSALADTARTTARKAGGKSAAALHAITEALEAERAALAPLDTAIVKAALDDLQALAQVWPDASHRQIKQGAKRIKRRARQAFATSRDAHDLEARHAWRKREKDRLFAATLLGDAWPYPRRRKRGEELGALLGAERDALILIERLEREPQHAGGEDEARRAVKALRRRSEKLSKRANALGVRLHASDA